MTEPTPCTIPHTCQWGESLVEPHFYELTKELAKKLRNIANQ